MKQTNIQASVFIAMSIDGFIARENDDIHWLTEASQNIGNVLKNMGMKIFIKLSIPLCYKAMRTTLS